LVTCGEDGIVRLFNLQGDCVQSIAHPGPVRSVKALGDNVPLGDFLTACADKSVRVFTRSVARFADEKARREFKEIGELVQAAGGMKQLDTSKLEDASALQKPGTKNGQVKVLRIEGRPNPIAFQWSEDMHEWIEIGEAMGAGAGGAGSGGGGSGGARSKYEGKEYDFVSDVYLTDEHVVKLCFNADDDPEEVTERFSTIYQVPADMRQQILDFVRPKCNAAAGSARKARLAQEQAQKIVLQQVPSWTSGSFETYSAANVAAMEKKLRESNAALAEQKHPHALTKEADVKAMADLFTSLRDPTQFHVAAFSPGEVVVVKHMLQWPAEHGLAVLDCLRVLMVHAGANAALGNDELVHARLFALVSEGKKDTYKILALKILSNFVAKRARAPSERAESHPTVPKPVMSFLSEALTQLADSAQAENENLALAYVMFLHKSVFQNNLRLTDAVLPQLVLRLCSPLFLVLLCSLFSVLAACSIVCWFGRLKIHDTEFFTLIATGICEVRFFGCAGSVRGC
jgi:hypothetical protein